MAEYSADLLTEVSEHEHTRFVNQAAQVAADLRRIADDIERAVKVSEAAHDQHGSDMVKVLHAFHWGVANLSFDGLARSAHEADLAERDAVVARAAEAL